MLGSRFDLAETLVELARPKPPEGLDDLPGAAPAARQANEQVLGDHCAELELQMQEMARRLHNAHPRTSLTCPICDSRMRLGASPILPDAVSLGVEWHGLECETCGLTTDRAYHAALGYREIRR